MVAEARPWLYNAADESPNYAYFDRWASSVSRGPDGLQAVASSMCCSYDTELLTVANSLFPTNSILQTREKRRSEEGTEQSAGGSVIQSNEGDDGLIRLDGTARRHARAGWGRFGVRQRKNLGALGFSAARSGRAAQAQLSSRERKSWIPRAGRVAVSESPPPTPTHHHRAPAPPNWRPGNLWATRRLSELRFLPADRADGGEREIEREEKKQSSTPVPPPVPVSRSRIGPSPPTPLGVSVGPDRTGPDRSEQYSSN